MRIGFDARAVRFRGGIGTYSRNLLREFGYLGVDVVVFCQDREKQNIPAAESFTLVTLDAEVDSWRGVGVLRAAVKEAGIDLLHVPTPWAPVPAPVPLVVTVHDVAPFLYPTVLPPLMRFRYRRQFARALQGADRVITVSRILNSALNVYAHADAAKIRVIYNGVSTRFTPHMDPKTKAAACRRHGLPERYVLWVGDFRPEKNVMFLIQAWARLSRRLADLPPLVLAGEKRGLYQKIKAEAERLGLGGQVLFPGYIPDDDLPPIYAAASLFVFPSLYEGFGLPPLEAMACGTPCVVSNSSSLPEVAGSAALLFNPTSLENFEECVARVLMDEELRENLREAGLRQAAAFSWSRAAEETLRVYREVLGGPIDWSEARGEESVSEGEGPGPGSEGSASGGEGSRPGGEESGAS